mmetsp:Transcript_18147/g.45102  ORF Transcript_18147/g.45102 Transcript_18147/m.45102 type:complete len:355 (+) Transcript_18147:206-1270(+)
MSSEYHFAEWYLLAAAGFTRSRGPPKFFRGRPGSFRPPSCVMRTSRSTAPTVCAHAPICEQRLPLCKKLPQSHTKHQESSSSPLSAPAMPLSRVSVRMNGLASLRATGRAVTRWQLCVFARIFFSTSSVAPFGRTSEPSMDLRKFIARVRVMSPMSSAPEPELMTNDRSPVSAQTGPSWSGTSTLSSFCAFATISTTNGPFALYVTLSGVNGAFLPVCARILGALVFRKIVVSARSPSLLLSFMPALDAVLRGQHAGNTRDRDVQVAPGPSEIGGLEHFGKCLLAEIIVLHLKDERRQEVELGRAAAVVQNVHVRLDRAHVLLFVSALRNSPSLNLRARCGQHSSKMISAHVST